MFLDVGGEEGGQWGSRVRIQGIKQAPDIERQRQGSGDNRSGGAPGLVS